VDGTASLVTGGTLDPPPPAPADPDTVRSTGIRGGETRKVGKGDVVVMPPGTPHWFEAIEGTVTYLESRVKVLAQPAPAAADARDFDAEIRAALQSAKTAAGFDFLGTLVRTCLLPQSGGENTTDNLPGYVTRPASAPARDTWYADPAKVFDNLYFVGGKLHSSWALTTSDGIILIDTIFPYNSEELIVGGLQKLGLDPKNIKYVLISHAHGDHIGGAEMLQTKYGARVVMGGPDWDLVAKYPNRYKTMAPKRDIVATDGMKITLGDTTVTTWATPGHTPGTLSYTFTALDRGRAVNVAYSGGTAFNFVNNTPDPGVRNFQTYIESQRHIAAQAAATGATVILSNHSEFDNAVNRNRMIAGRGDGPHPYELGADAVQRYFQVMQGCARAAQLGLEQKAGATR
jgi:metallo-beta-lactamase class B